MGFGYKLEKIFFNYPLEVLFKLDDAKINVERKVFHKKHPVDRSFEELVSSTCKVSESLSELLDVLPTAYGENEDTEEDYEEYDEYDDYEEECW